MYSLYKEFSKTLVVHKDPEQHLAKYLMLLNKVINGNSVHPMKYFGSCRE